MTVSGPVAESLAGRGAGKVAARRNRGGAAGRVGWPTYLILGVVLLLSAYPLYYSFLLGSSDAATIAREPVPSLIPQGNFLDNVVRVVSSDIKFWQALANSIFVSALTAVSVAALTIYDMLKAIDQRMVIEDVRLDEKRGGRSGHYRRAPTATRSRAR